MKPTEHGDDERLEGPGFVMERHGRFIQMASTLNAAEHAEMRQRMGESAPELRQEMAEGVEQLCEILHRHKPEAMLAAMWFRNSPFGSSDDGSSSDDGTQSHGFVEFVATLYVRDSGDGQECVVLPHVLEDVQSRVQALFTKALWLWMAVDARRGREGRDQNLEELRYLTFMDSLFVRYPGHHQHLTAVLNGIDTSMQRDLGEHLGWNVGDAVRIAECAVALVEDRLNDAYESAREAAFENDVESLGNEDEQRRLYGLAAWLVFRAQDAAVFTVQEIAEASAVPVDRVQAFLDAACLPWGTCGEEFYGFPHATPPIQRQPVLKLDGDRYFLPLPTSLLWAVRPVVEDALKADASGDGKAWWHRYERARAGFAEAHAVSLLARAMPHAGAFHSLKYPWAKDGQQIEAELDGLVIVDDLALLVEVKSGGMSLEARRGAPNGMTEDLTALVGEPHEQALRARDYLRSADEVEFVLHDGTTLRVESGRLDDFIMVTVTLDALDVFTATLYKLTDLGVVGDGDLPWAVSLLDLAVISEVFEFPAQLIHFLRRRARLNQLAFVMAHDELDWIGHYLWEGLWFEHLVSSCEDEGAQPIVNFFGYSGEVDAHFIHAGRDGDDGPPMPRQEMPDDMRTFLRELEDAQHPGYMHVSLAVLDLGTEAREQFFQGMADAVQRTVNDGRPHNFTMVLENRQGGLTFGCDVDRDSLHSFLRSYCQLKMHQARCSEWVGIGRLVSSKFMLDEAVVLRHPWESDEELERLGTEILQPLPERDEERE